MPKRQKPAQNKTAQLLVMLVGIALIAVYLIWDYDPLHIFTPTPTPVATATPEAAPRRLATPTPARETPPPTTTSPSADWWQVYFTEPKLIPKPKNPAVDVPAGSIEAELILRISRAQRSIHIAAFEFDLTPIAEALIAAKKRGVDVKWVTDDEHGLESDEERGHGQFALMQKAGIPVKDDNRSALMHNKFWIFDGAVVWTGATNITMAGIFENNNNAIAIQSPELAAIYEREFAEMWAGQFGPKSPSTVDQQSVTVHGVKMQALFASEDKVIEKLIPFVTQARSSIRVMAFVLMHDGLGQALLSRANAGVNVAGIVESLQSETASSELPPLYCAGVPMKQDTNPTMFHHKVIVIDGEILITGSLNFSDSAEKSNDENVLIVWNRDIAAAYLAEFDRRWPESKDPDPADMKCPNVRPTALMPLSWQTVPTQPTAPPVATIAAPNTACDIKGNISSGNKFYYLPGDPGYGSVKIDETQGERMFCSELEAQQAGWRRKR